MISSAKVISGTSKVRVKGERYKHQHVVCAFVLDIVLATSTYFCFSLSEAFEMLSGMCRSRRQSQTWFLWTQHSS
jgi:hypothetical protein